MFMKRKTIAENAYVYRILLSFETCNLWKEINFMPDNSCVRCEEAFVGHSSTPMSGATIQACLNE